MPPDALDGVGRIEPFDGVGFQRDVAALAAFHQGERRRFGALEPDGRAGSARPVEEIAQQPGPGQIDLDLLRCDGDAAQTGQIDAGKLSLDGREPRRAPVAAEFQIQLVRRAPRAQVHAAPVRYQARVLCVPSHNGALAECLQVQK